jgi:predicted DNA-binding transcriptional regulator AlpA
MGRRSDISRGRLVMQFTIPEVGFIRLREVLTVIPVGRSCWWDGVKSGRFPRPVKLSARCTAWKAEDIRELVKRIGERNGVSYQ